MASYTVLDEQSSSVADPGFPRGMATNPAGWGRQHTILPNFPQKCIKLKEFGPGGKPKNLLCRSATGLVSYTQNSKQRQHFILDFTLPSLSLKHSLSHHQYSVIVAINAGFPLRLEKNGRHFPVGES